ncbi:ABC transporter permease [Enterococcus saigonensis]|uniref:ABC transporter permease n=1 Tax=Enterococcus saigonensis TaxID=1805431 RepID=A0A679IA08_9ENTE|nr:ABC transporter permease [Enterococcus saigonensis]BCA84869.1 ABC transporter permease [Enterococcus saigonensis]
MNFRQFVVRNTMRNKHLYLAYFLSTLFAVMVFFTFSVFAFHPKLGGDALNSQAQIGMLGAAIIIYGFAFFFVLYSMDVFLQSRKKEFGLLMIQGMSPKQLRKMVFIENIVIGFFATISGSVVGILFSQFILWLSNFLMRIDLGFYFPTQALVLTVVAFMALFFIISFVIQFRLPKLNVQTLLKAGELGKGTFKISPLKSGVAILLLAAGYATALLAPGASVFVVFLPVVFVVIVGTKFLFDQLSVWVIEKLRKNDKIFWKKTNMVVFSDLAFRMKDNARSFFLVAIISTVAFSAIGSLYGFRQLIVGSMDETPYAFQALDAKESSVNAVNNALQKYDIQSDEVPVTVYTGEKIQVISQREYTKLARAAKTAILQPKAGEAIQLKDSSGVENAASTSAVTVAGTKLKVVKEVDTTILSTFIPTYVVNDQVAFNDYKANHYVYWFNPDASINDQIKVGKAVEKNKDIVSVEFMKDTIIQSFAPILFVGIFIGIVFFVSAGSFLYFRLYSDMDVDIEKFKMIYKMGLAKKELKKMIYQQIGILFFTPIIVSVVHGAIALTAMYHMFNLGMQLAGWQVLGVFVVIQIIYYLIARVFYFRKVYQAVTA